LVAQAAEAVRASLHFSSTSLIRLEAVLAAAQAAEQIFSYPFSANQLNL